MKQAFHFLFFLFLLSALQSGGQDTLPNFSARNVGNNRVILGWVNQFPNIRQISIQRSFDSLSGYKTILTVADPKAVQNGYADTKAPNDHMFYRLFYAMEGGAFYFTTIKKPFTDTSATAVTSNARVEKGNGLADPALRSFIPSFYVYTEKTGYVQLNLPNPDLKKYSIKFFDDEGSFLFELKNLKDRLLTLDKSNFLHAGWFHFELYNDEKLVEKHRFYLSKDF